LVNVGPEFYSGPTLFPSGMFDQSNMPEYNSLCLIDKTLRRCLRCCF